MITANPVDKQEFFLWIPQVTNCELYKGTTTRNDGIAEPDVDTYGWHCAVIGSAVLVNFISGNALPAEELSGYSTKDTMEIPAGKMH